MAKHIHFVVAVDLETKKWWVDDELFTLRFEEDEGTWDTETQDWRGTDWDDNIAALEILNAAGQTTDK